MKKLFILFLLVSLMMPFNLFAADSKISDLPAETGIQATYEYVINAGGISKKITAINTFDLIDTFSELDTIVADKALVNKADGAVWSGAHDLGGATSTELVNNATPTTNATGEIALDTTITDHQPLWQYFDGEENMTVIAIDTSELPAQDNEIIKYNAGTDKWVLEADAGSGFAWQLDPKSAKLPASNPMRIDAGNLQWRGLFDDTTDECARWQNVLTPYAGGGLDIDIVYSLETTSSSDVVELEVYVMCGKSDADMDTDSFDTVNNLSSGAVSTTAGFQAKLAATLSNDDSCAEDDLIIIKICRDADTTDTTADDVEFRGASVHE